MAAPLASLLIVRNAATPCELIPGLFWQKPCYNQKENLHAVERNAGGGFLPE